MFRNCEPGSRSCTINTRVHYTTDFTKPSIFDLPRSEHQEPKSGRAETPRKLTESAADGERKDQRYVRTNPLKPTIEELTPEQIRKARMVQASRKAYESGFEAAQEYLDDKGIAYDIDETLSSPESLVLVGDDDVVISYRGTKIKNVSDVSADAAIAGSVEDMHPQFKNAEEQIKLVQSKYGQVDELMGYSLGGAKALTMGERFSIKSTTFNPFLGPKILSTNSKTEHTILRTTEDFASLGLALGRKKNWNVESVLPHTDKVNPVEAHELHNFTETSARRPGATETLVQSVIHQGTRTGELELLHDMKIAQEKGQSFTEFMGEFSPADSNGTELIGTRMHGNSKWVRFWDDVKSNGSSEASFTPKERSYFDSLPANESVSKPVVRPSERKAFASKHPAERAVIVAENHSKLGDVAKAVDAHTELHTSAASALKRSVHPTNLATGLAGGMVASAAMEAIDHDHKLHPVVREGLEGGLAAAGSEAAAAALVGGTLTAAAAAPAVVGGAAGYIAGGETNKVLTGAMENAGVDKDVSEAVGATVGGAVGGGVAAGTAIGVAALIGTEGGAALGPVGALVGAGVGALIGAGSWLVGKIFG